MSLQLSHSPAEDYRRIFGHFASLHQATGLGHPTYARTAP
jgi:hypothetical protein